MNWVERRHECNARHALRDLRAKAKDNVETRTHQLHAERSPAGPLPRLEEDTEDGFTVTRNGDTVKFEMTDARTIRVTGSSISIFTVKVGLDDNQSCELIVAGELREPWQVLYMALDKLRF